MSAAIDIGNDQAVLDAAFVFKAMPLEEGDDRFIYLESSRQTEDLQGETILRKALWTSRDYYISRGNIDIDHVSVLGRRMGVEKWWEYEIGRPTDVRLKDGVVWVKGYLYKGCTMADSVWETLNYNPPQVWFASVSGAILARDPTDPSKITEVRWNNTALTREPVNHKIRAAVSTQPIGAFAKGLSLVPKLGADAFAKALTAGYGTDSAGFTGGAALRMESLAGAHTDGYRRFKAHASRKLLKRGARIFTRAHLESWARECGYSEQDAAGAADRFYKDVATDLKQKRRET